MLTPPDPKYPVIDGFLYDTKLKCDLRFRSMVLAEFEALRRARAFRTRMLLAPEDPKNIVIPKFDSYEYQLYTRPGSAFWGYSFVATAGQFSVQVTDSCTDVALFSEIALAKGDGSKQRNLSKLLVVTEPGLLNVEICNLTATDAVGVQFILWGGEPGC